MDWKAKKVKYKQRMFPKLLVLIDYAEKTEQQLEKKYFQHHFQHNFISKNEFISFRTGGIS